MTRGIDRENGECWAEKMGIIKEKNKRMNKNIADEEF